MDRFNKIQFNKYKDKYSNFGEDMYGVSVKIPTHATRSLYSRAPIYFGDYGSPYGFPYVKPPSGGVFAADGDDGKSSDSKSENQKPSSDINPLYVFVVVSTMVAGAVNEKGNRLSGAITYGIGAVIGVAILDYVIKK